MPEYPSAADKQRPPSTDDQAELHDMLNTLAEQVDMLASAGQRWVQAAVKSWPENGDTDYLVTQMRGLADQIEDATTVTVAMPPV